MKIRIVLAVTALLIGLGLYQWSNSEAGGSGLASALEAGGSIGASAPPELTVSPETEAGADRTDEVTGTQEVSVEGVGPPASGWWLVGKVAGIPEAELGSTRLRITGSSGSGWSSHTISGDVQAGGHVRVDLQEIFRSGQVLPSELFARVSHPGLSGAEQRWPVSRKERQRGHAPGELVVFELSLELEPTRGEVRGVVSLPGGYQPSQVLVSLIPAPGDTPEICGAVSQERCGVGGEFRLGFDRPGRYHVLATHVEQALRPAFIELELDRGRVELEQPLEVDEGAVLEGVVTLNSAVPTFGLQLGASRKVQVPGPYCPNLRGVTWDAGSYQHNSARGQTTSTGQLRITGLSAGIHKLRVDGIRIGNEWVGMGSLGRGVRATRELELPMLFSTIDFGFQVQLFRTVSKNRPLPYVKVLARTLRSTSTASTGANGQLAQAYTASSSTEPGLTLDFSEVGYEKRSLPILNVPQTLEWQLVEMLPTMAGEATLVVSLLGDPNRSLERFSVLLLREGERRDSFDLFPWQKTQWKRGEEAVRIEGIEPGVYRLTLKADSPANPRGVHWPDTDSTVLDEVLELELSAGEERKLPLHLRIGGRLFLPAVCPEGDCGGRTGGVLYRVRKGNGELIETSWVTASDSGSRGRSIGGLNLDRDSYLDPPLEAGDYELEVWLREQELDRIAHPFRILPGEITRLEINDPR